MHEGRRRRGRSADPARRQATRGSSSAGGPRRKRPVRAPPRILADRRLPDTLLSANYTTADTGTRAGVSSSPGCAEGGPHRPRLCTHPTSPAKSLTWTTRLSCIRRLTTSRSRAKPFVICGVPHLIPKVKLKFAAQSSVQAHFPTHGGATGSRVPGLVNDLDDAAV